MDEYKIQRVEGSKIRSNLSNKSTSTKLPVIITFNSMDGVKKFTKNHKRKYHHIPAVATEMTMAEVHELSTQQIDYDEPVKALSDGANYWYGTEMAMETATFPRSPRQITRSFDFVHNHR